MSNINLKRYQEDAVDELIVKSNIVFNKNLEKRTIVFQAPTGSGKTFMMSNYIERIIEERENEDLCFLWVSIGKGELHIQSYESIKKYFNGYPSCYLLESEFFGSRENILKNEVVIVNWEKLRTKDKKTGEWKNILMKDKETTNVRELIYNTQVNKTKIIMIIDESHSNSSSDRAIELRDEIINPDLTIEMSATPSLIQGQFDEKVVVQANDVIEEGMIKKEIIINENLDIIVEEEETSQEFIMKAAYKKRIELINEYKNNNIDINPLVLIQLPTSEAGEDKKEFVENFLSDKGVLVANKKLAIWLDKEKENLENISDNLNEVEFLIFKQAIDTGWDCPRAQILVRFREIKSLPFEIQTIGRILRMPEAKHYLNDELNKGYVYTNIKSIEVKKESYNPNIIKSVFVKRREEFININLNSYYRNRIDFGDLTSSFYISLENVFCKEFEIEKDKNELYIYDENKKIISKKIDIKNLEKKDEIILNKELNTKLFDYLSEKEIKSDKFVSSNLSQIDMQHIFENLIRVNLNGFAPKRSIPTFKQALYRWFKKYLNINLVGNGIIFIQNICINNFEFFSQLFDKAINEYKPIKQEEIKLKIENTEKWDENWSISENRNYNPNTYDKYNYDKYFYSPCYLRLNNLEKEFIEFIVENKDKINWWWQNGSEHMEINFGIKYGDKNTFQPDFIINFKNGFIGIFDTKASGEREEDNKAKGEALQKYILTENGKGKNLIGGLVIKEGNHFRVNRKEIYKSFNLKPKDWEYFTEII